MSARITVSLPVGGSHRFCDLRNPFIRVLLIAAVLLLLMLATMRTDPVYVRSKVLGNPNRMTVLAQQSVLLDPDHGVPIIVNANGSDLEEDDHIMNCNVDTYHLRRTKDRYGLSNQIEHYKHYVRFTRLPIHSDSYTRLQQPFLSLPASDYPGPLAQRPNQTHWTTLKTVDVTGDDYIYQTCPAPLQAPVTQSPFPADADLSEFMFAVSTTYVRLSDPMTSPLREWNYWLTDSSGRSNGGKLLLQLVEASVAQLSAVTDSLARAGIDTEVGPSDGRLEMAMRYLGLVPKLHSHPDAARKKWLVLCDDDTLFPSPNALAERFRMSFDPRKPLYIGTLSEDVGAVDRHGSQAFGGAGVFLSLSLPFARQVALFYYSTCVSRAKIDKSDSGWGPQGDILLRKCIYENTNVRLTPLRDLWQLDLIGDLAGFYEGGLEPLSLHHFQGSGWHYAFPQQMTKVAHACGEDCAYQRLVTADGFVISNGFSVAQYPEGIDFDLEQLEGTFYPAPENKGWNLDFMFGPQRPALTRTGKKIAWEMREARNEPDGSVTQVYVRRRDDWRWTRGGERIKETDGIIELVWYPS